MNSQNLGIIIQARMGATRLPNKLLLPFYKSLTVLDILLEKLSKQFPNSCIVLATTTSEKDNCIVDIAKNYSQISVFRGSEQNVLERFIMAASSHNVDKIIRICADNPFLDMQYLDFLLTNAVNTNYDYVGFQFPNGTPTIKSHIGLFAEYTTLSALKKVAELTQDKLYIEHVTNYIYANPDVFNCFFYNVPDFISNRTDVRLTLDTPADFELLKELFHQMMEIYATDNMNFLASDLLSTIDKKQAYLNIMQLEITNNSK